MAIDANTRASKAPYEPTLGSLADKVVLITGGTAGLGLVSFPILFFHRICNGLILEKEI